jgi:surface polysaccharide O-acyltransferase-like enzyme
MQGHVGLEQTDNAPRKSVRLYYLDWLRVLATLGVFLLHATCVFNTLDFHIKNAEQSTAITVIHGFFLPWGMALFFLIAGAGSWFALQRRTPGQYARERFNRLLIPFVVGSLLLSPIARYFEWSHKVQMGVEQGSFLEFIESLAWGLTPRFFGVAGYHLWFVGFLFCYSLLALPLFRWLRGESGQRFVLRGARLCEHHGGLLLFILPLLVVRLSLQPFFPQYGNWANFASFLSFFILGYLLFADKRFTQAVWRDWPIMLTVGIAAFLALVAISMATAELDIEGVPRTPLDYVWWALFTACGWCWTAFMVFVGMRFLNHSNKWLQYGQDALLPFFVVHEPVIIVIAYFVVQWNVGLVPKVLAVVLGSFAVSLGFYQYIVRRVGPLRALFGMKERPKIPAVQSGEAVGTLPPA